MTTTPITSITDELLAEIEKLASNATPGPWVYNAGEDDEESPWSMQFPTVSSQDREIIGTEGFYSVKEIDEANAEFVAVANPATMLALTTELRRLRADNEALRKVCKDVAWRVSDTCDQLQATGFDGDRRYGLDEWSAPIKNLSMAVGILERTMQSNKEGN